MPWQITELKQQAAVKPPRTINGNGRMGEAPTPSRRTGCDVRGHPGSGESQTSSPGAIRLWTAGMAVHSCSLNSNRLSAQFKLKHHETSALVTTFNLNSADRMDSAQDRLRQIVILHHEQTESVSSGHLTVRTRRLADGMPPKQKSSKTCTPNQINSGEVGQSSESSFPTHRTSWDSGGRAACATG